MKSRITDSARTPRRTRVPGLIAALLGLTTATAACAVSPARQVAVARAARSAAPRTSEVPTLPRPAGPYAVGRDILHLVDRHRTDPWVPTAGPRQLMVSMYYPARPGTGGPAPYMTVDEARLFLREKAPGVDAPPALLSGTRTWAHTGARPAHGRFPLVVLSPGLGFPRATLTGLAEDLAGRGYVVALVDHTYENSGTTFPDGRTLACVICDEPPAGGPPAIARSRAEDVSFVLDRLTGHHPAWRHAGLIDPRRIGMAGHSIGGDATATTMATDHRVDAGVNMDGTFYAQVPAGGLARRPFLMFGAEHEAPGIDDTWGQAWRNLNGWKRWLTVTGSDHGTFTDLPILAAWVGRPGTGISPQRAEEITRAYVGAFFDLHLKGVRQPLLDGPSPANPEVVFQHP
ncbi:alpha/beta hydrolase family protein [Actinoallomurus rhizosphaericola]|uniref:alpha/beta hydrolase family protein n=1 Tax=Actinoallomurus rhizosphaericola TaxID=2952536 RepID=UPI002092B204|nr:alpha/beta hydrolase [Actinoallomurus rhizosphaericola]MCO5995943.1 alpha/beta hydrolase [Actinoallomurus rhizosphaericola]